MPDGNTVLLAVLIMSLFTTVFSNIDQVAYAATINPYYHFPCYYDAAGFSCNYLVKEDNYHRFHHVIYGLMGEPYSNPYSVNVNAMHLDIDRNSLVVDMTTDQNGTLALVLPKIMIQAVSNETTIITEPHMQEVQPIVPKENETDFVVLINGKSSDFNEIRTENVWECCDESGQQYHPTELFDINSTWHYRILEIPFTKDAEEIQVVGTWVSGDPRDFGLEFCVDVLCPYDVNLGNQTYAIKYKFGEPDFNSGNITLNNITFNAERNSLLVNFTVSEKLRQFGVLDITIPANLLKPLPSGDYAVLIDGKPENMTYSTISIGYTKEGYSISDGIYFDSTAGDRQIEIIGTNAVPEFSLFVGLATAIGVSTTIVLQRMLRRTT